MVSRVPYKKMSDSQTSNSRLSPELCCKDQYRSNNNSALSDDTRSPISPGMPLLEMVWDTDSTPTTRPRKALPAILLTQTCWITKDTEAQITYHRGDEDSTTCWWCQQHFTTPRHLRVHLPQHFITTFCPCGEYSYHSDYILRHQRTMGHLYDVDEASYQKFLRLIQPLIMDLARYERLAQGFPAPRPITHRPVPKPPGYKKPRTLLSSEPIPRPRILPRVVLQRIDTQPCKRSLSPVSPTDRKRRWQSSSPPRHSSLAWNLREVEQRTHELEREVHRLAPRISAAASELKALRESIARLKRESQD